MGESGARQKNRMLYCGFKVMHATKNVSDDIPQ